MVEFGLATAVMIIALTFLIGYMFFSEHVTPLKVLGISLIILGLILLNRK